MKKEGSCFRPALGLLLTSLALVRGLYLPDSTGPARLILPLCLLGLAALAILFLKHEGCGRETLAAMLLPVGLALCLRAFFLPHQTLDYRDFLSKWVQFFRDNGGFAALNRPIGNYNVPYLYLLAFFSCLPVPDLYLIKLASLLADVFLAWGGFRLARAAGGEERTSLTAFSVLLLLPTVILNGACWGQCDSIWAALCVHALADVLDRRSLRSVCLMALAFSFKLQAIFILPLWGALWLCDRVKFRQLWAFPGVFALTMVPALLLGKPVRDILGVYFGQAGDSLRATVLNYNSSSVFSLFPYNTNWPSWAGMAGILLAAALVLAVLLLLACRKSQADGPALFLAGILLSLGVPFFLPYMHERYFFLGGVLLAVWACCQVRGVVPAVGAELSSLGGYHAYLLNRFALPVTLFGVTWTQGIEGLLMLGAVVWTAAQLWRRLTDGTEQAD